MIDGQFFPGQAIQFEQPRAIRNPWYRHRLIDVIQRQGLTTNLELCLDAADGNSLPAASTKWLDTSGNGFDFFRGTTAGADATDPTINGSADGRSSSEYLSFDGGDLLQYDTTNETWMQNIHKDNAVFTIAMWIYYASITGTQGGIGTRGAAAGNTGFTFFQDGGTLTLAIQNAGTAVATISTAAGVTANQWEFLAVSLTEATGANGAILQRAGTQTLHTSTYSSPSAGNASFTMQLGSRGNANLPLPSGSRMGGVMMWEGTALTAAQLMSLYIATKGRYGV